VIQFISYNFISNMLPGTDRVPCECCAARIELFAYSGKTCEVLNRDKGKYEVVPSHGIVVAPNLGDLYYLLKEDSHTQVDLGDGEHLYIRYSHTEYA
jgi:hypothetical protein